MTTPTTTTKPSTQDDVGMPTTSTSAKINLTHAARENAAETGCDPLDDLAALRSGEHTTETLLAHCIDGADEDRVQGWHEYVAAIVAAL